MKKLLLESHHLVELISLLIAIIYYRYIKRSFMKWFVPFLSLIILGEFLGHIDSVSDYSNYVLAVIQLLFYSYIFYELHPEVMVKQISIWIVGIDIVGYTISFIFLDDSNSSMITFTRIYILASISITFLALFYIYRVVKSNEGQILLHEPGFWLALGVIMFFAGFSLTLSFYPVIIKQKLRLWGEPLYRIVPRVLCFILYSSISVAMVLCKRGDNLQLAMGKQERSLE